jgi:hypothetical protein
MNCNAGLTVIRVFKPVFPRFRESVLRGEITAVSAARSLLADFEVCPDNTDYDNKN